MSDRQQTAKINGVATLQPKNPMVKTYSFTGSEDGNNSDDAQEPASPSIEQDEQGGTLSSTATDGVTGQTTGAVSLADGDTTTEASVKIKKKKRRRKLEEEAGSEVKVKEKASKLRRWISKIDLTKPLVFVAILFCLYFMWVKRDIWIRRLLIPDRRFRQYTATPAPIEEEPQLGNEVPSVIESSSQSILSPEDDEESEDSDHDEIENENDSNDAGTTDNTITAETPTATKQGYNIKFRFRNRPAKMSFSRDKKKKRPRSTAQDGSVPDVSESTDVVQEQEQEKETEILPPVVLPSKKTVQRSRRRELAIPSSSTSGRKNYTRHRTTAIRSIINVNLIEQLTAAAKVQGREKNLWLNLKNAAGIDRTTMRRFFDKQDYNAITLQTFLSMLDTLDLTLVVVPK